MAEKPILIYPIAGDKIKASVYTGNFKKFEDYIDKTVFELTQFTKEYVISQMSSLTNTVANIRLIGQPIIRLDNTILDDEIRLEGGTVSRETYASLFSLYGETYGKGNGVTTFQLPDFRNRAVWGASEFGYVEAGLPNITGRLSLFTSGAFFDRKATDGAFANLDGRASRNQYQEESGPRTAHFDASKSNPIYGKSETVQPPAIKVRVVTRYK